MVQQITTKAKFDEVLASAGSKLVVVDFYATWCGPCRMIAPFIEELSQKYPDVVFIKVDVDENEETAQVAGISAMPTFHGYRNGERVGEVIGASKDKLVQMIESQKQ